MEGKKFDLMKPDWSLMNLDTIEGVVKVLTMGAKKYDRHNWVNVEPYRYYSATLRHLTDYQRGNSIDEESGLHHLYHAMCNLYFLIEHEKNGSKYSFQNEDFKK